MTREIDPVRWTATGSDVPESLRDLLRAGLDECPSDEQMETLMIRLAAVSAVGGAAAAAATSAKAGSTLTSLGTGSLTLAKVTAALTITSALVVGGSQLLAYRNYRNDAERAAARTRSHAVQVSPPAATPGSVVSAASPRPGEPVVTSLPQALKQPAVKAIVEAREPIKETRRASAPRAKGPALPAEAVQPEVDAREQNAGGLSAEDRLERDMLREAREALTRDPRAAFAITERHRAQFPQGRFAQEREALAVEALLRAGDARARAEAQRFIDSYPSSPHAHRFREALGL